jgi:hypothetical protein
MKKTTLLLILTSFIFFGCEKDIIEPYPSGYSTYPTLDGTYLVSFVRHDGVNTYEGYDDNNTKYDGVVSTSIGDLNVGEEKVSFSGATFYMGYEVFHGGDDWNEEYYFDVSQGVDGFWDDLRIDYFIGGVLYPRNFIIEEDGLEHILLKFPNQQLSNGEYINMWVKLSRVGP